MLLLLLFLAEIPSFAGHLKEENLVEYVNFKQDLFKASRCNYSEEEKRARVMSGKFKTVPRPEEISNEVQWIMDDAIPESFDSRTHWPSCNTMKFIYDQGQCGSCWSFCSAEVMSDRSCVATSQQIEISADDVLSCCSDCGYGCGGGWPIKAFNYWTASGVVTGGGYNSHRGCKPYQIAPGGPAATPACKQTCESGYSTPYSQDKHLGKGGGYFINNAVASIQKEIMAYGPVSAIFDVYGDFYQYSGGIYIHTGGAYYGSHCVKVLGWGVSKSVPYWLVANSWGRTWGESGYFRIRRGTNECGFESQMSTAHA